MSTDALQGNKGLPRISRLSEVLLGQIRGRILTLLFGNPDQRFYLRQIARLVETSAGNVQRELGTLAEIDVIDRAPVGSQVYFWANRKHPIFSDLRSLIAKTTGIFQQLATALEPLAPRLAFDLQLP
jgi:hypothetical protein